MRYVINFYLDKCIHRGFRGTVEQFVDFELVSGLGSIFPRFRRPTDFLVLRSPRHRLERVRAMIRGGGWKLTGIDGVRRNIVPDSFEKERSIDQCSWFLIPG